MKNEDVVKAFLRREIGVSKNLSSSGDRLYSYNTCIAEFDKFGRLWYNSTKYSTTTSKHQSLVRRHGVIHEWVEGIERNKRYIVPKNESIYG